MTDPAEDLIQLSAYLDRELDGAEAGRIAALLLTNSALAEEYKLLKQIRDELSCWDKYDCIDVCASPAFEDKLTERLRQLRGAGSKSPGASANLTTVSRN